MSDLAVFLLFFLLIGAGEGVVWIAMCSVLRRMRREKGIRDV